MDFDDYDGYDQYYESGDSEDYEDDDEYDCEDFPGFHLLYGEVSTEQDERENGDAVSGESKTSSPPSLFALAAGLVGRTMPFEEVEAFSAAVQVIPDNVQLSIMKAAFPTDKSIIRRCAYLSRKGDGYGAYDDLKPDAKQNKRWVIKDAKQIGFTLHIHMTTADNYQRHYHYESESATVLISFDRCKITSVSCSKHKDIAWCPHIVHATFHRINNPSEFEYHLPISESVQRLTEFQQKQFISIILSQFQLDLLGPAQAVLNALQSPSTELPSGQQGLVDPTAGGSIGTDATWFLSIDDAFKGVTSSSNADEALGRYCHGQVVHWSDDLKAREWMGLITTTKKEPNTSKKEFSYSSKKLDDFIFLAKAFLKEGSCDSLDVLRMVSDNWLACLEDKLDKTYSIISKEYHRYEKQSLGVDEKPVLSTDQAVGALPSNNYQKNRELVSSSKGDQCFPDHLASCLQLAALCPSFTSNQKEQLQVDLLKWAKRFDECISKSQSLINAYAKHFTGRRSYMGNWQELWISLGGWNGFAYVAALLETNVPGLLQKRSLVPPNSESSADYRHLERSVIVDAKFLRTVCVLMNVFKFFKEEKAAHLLTVAVTVRFLEAMGAKPVKERSTQEAQEVDSALFNAYEIHVAAADAMWGEGVDDDFLTPLLALWETVMEADKEQWRNDRSFDLAPLLQSEEYFSADQCSSAFSWRVGLALLCLIQDSSCCKRDKKEQCIQEVNSMVSRNSVISDVISHAEDFGGTVFIEWLRNQVVQPSCSRSAPLILIAYLLGSPSHCQHDFQMACPQFSTVVLSLFRSQTEEVRQLLQTDLTQSPVVATKFFNLLCECTVSMLHGVLLGLHNDEILETIASSLILPLKPGIDKESPTWMALSRNSYYLCHYFDRFRQILALAAPPYESKYDYYRRTPSLSEVFVKVNLNAVTEAFPFKDKAVSNEGKELLSEVNVTLYWKAVSGIFIHTLTALHDISIDAREVAREVAGCREAILKFLQEAKQKVGFSCFLDIWNSKTESNWTALGTTNEICQYLLSDDEEFDIRELTDLQTRNLLSLLMELTACCHGDSNDVIKVIKQLKAVDLVFDQFVGNTEKYEKTVSHSMFFLLAREGSPVSVTSPLESAKKRFSLAVAGFRRFSESDEGNETVPKYHARHQRSFSDMICLLVGLACYIDQTEREHRADPLFLPVVSDLFHVVLDVCHPCLSFLFVIQAANLAYNPEATAMAISSKLKTPIFSFSEFAAKKSAIRDIQQIWNKTENASSLITKCKQALLGKLEKKKRHQQAQGMAHLADGLPEENRFSFDDLVALHLILQAFPDKSVNLENLLTFPEGRGCSVEEIRALEKFGRYVEAPEEEVQKTEKERGEMLRQIIQQQLLQYHMPFGGLPFYSNDYSEW